MVLLLLNIRVPQAGRRPSDWSRVAMATAAVDGPCITDPVGEKFFFGWFQGITWILER